VKIALLGRNFFDIILQRAPNALPEQVRRLGVVSISKVRLQVLKQ
jgi:hypothetical protein